MNDGLATLDPTDLVPKSGKAEQTPAMALVIAWSASEPQRIGEVAHVPEDGAVRMLGRGEAVGEGRRVRFFRQRPGALEAMPPLGGQRLSREQLRIRAKGDALVVESVGRCPMLSRGAAVPRVVLEAGDTVLLQGELLLLCVRRALALPPLRDLQASAIAAFGEADTLGMIGESPAAWLLRDRLAWHAKVDEHLLILGESGTGKEVAARAVHALSARARGPFVARNAATIPTELMDAELFGNAKGYPNPGMPERPGLIGHASGGTLFLDEIGELPQALQAHLLRVLDGGGEYHRLGDATARRADLRLLAATNRDPEALKHDLLARLTLRLPLPGLEVRREDIPLLARHLLKRAQEKSPEVVGRFMAADLEPRLAPELVEHLLAHRFTTHVRELEALLWRAMSASTGDRITLPADPTFAPVSAPTPAASAASAPLAVEPTADEIRARLDEHAGKVAAAARALGLPSRFALYRLLRKHGIATDKGEDDGAGG